MKVRSIVIMLCLLVAAGVWLLRPSAHRSPSAMHPSSLKPAVSASNGLSTNNVVAQTPNRSVLSTNKLSLRLSNTTNSLGQLLKHPHAILLDNALIDTDLRTSSLKIPAHLRHQGDPGAYIVQARMAVNASFRNLLSWAGASIVSYIPNNAYLVEVSPSGASSLAESPLVQAVLPYEPYYKVQSSLLDLAVNQEPLPPGTVLTLGLLANDASQTEKVIANQPGMQILPNTDVSPFGPIIHVQTTMAADWVSLAQLPGVEVMEVAHHRTAANDLSRVALGISTDTLTPTNYLNLYGSNVLVEVNDSGIDATHPDFTTGGSPATGKGSTPIRVIGDSPLSLVDTNGHGTHVAGIIAGNGDESWGHDGNPQVNVGLYASGSVSNADFRGKAPLATLFSVGGVGGYDPFAVSDYYFQSTPALTNALISNNSWAYADDQDYDLAAASYDAATRDALPFVSGSQPVLFVFAAGNDGVGNSDGSGGNSDTIYSPGTAKNVITVGALEQPRNITNVVTDANSNQSAYWLPETDSSSQVADYSSRGNVGIGTEGNYGRFKPDVVAPGSFVVSTRSSQWNTNVYYNPTNNQYSYYADQTATTNVLNYYNVNVPNYAVGIIITIIPNQYSTISPTNLPIYVSLNGLPTNSAGEYDIVGNGSVSIPPQTGGNITSVSNFWGGGFWFAVADNTNVPVNYDVSVSVLYTNNDGNYYSVLEGLNDSLGPYYRYESGTSMAAAGVSGVLALIQDFFTNTLQTVPSPALLKAMLINGSRSVGGYSYAVTNGVNSEGWGMPNIQNTLPFTLSTNNNTVATNGTIFFVDQSPTNALATGQSHTYTIALDTNNYANYLPLQVTLAWTDPPGNPAAAIKLVNSLELVVTNLDTGDVFYGNDFEQGNNFNNPAPTNVPPNIDTINNVQNVVLEPLLGGNYSITVIGRAVNVNAVTLQTNDVVQDFALVVACGEGEVPTAITSVTDNGIVSQPTSDQNITFVTTTNSPLFNQFAGENSPLLGTNTIPLGPNTVWGTNGQLTIGMTNQWHFYVITNTGLTSDTTNAIFMTFQPYTLSIPRIGVFADSDADSTRVEADIDLFATTDAGLTNLSPVTISNCVYGVGDNKSSLGAEGTEFVYFIDSKPGTVYYIGVKSEDHMGSEYDFMPIFTSTPFSQNNNGDLLALGLLLPTVIPDGSNAHPGTTNVFAVAIPELAGLSGSMQIAKVVVTNQVQHQNFGDLYGVLNFDDTAVILNNHDALGNTYGLPPRVYNDSLEGTNGSVKTDGPGNTLRNYNGQVGAGVWIQYQADEAPGNTGEITAFSVDIQPHLNFKQPGITVAVPAGGWFVDYVQVPVGYEELNLYATNVTIPYADQPIQFYEEFNAEPTFTSYDQEVLLTNCLPNSGVFPAGTYPGNSISTGPPLPMGLYYVAIYNPSVTVQQVFLSYNLVPVPVMAYVTANTGAMTITNDAVSDSTVFITSTQQIAAASVGMVIDSPRISDLAITLVNQTTGQRILLMENRGGTDTNGAGSSFTFTNTLNQTATGGDAPNTNAFSTGQASGTVPITYNFYTVPDEMTVYYGSNNISPANLILDTGLISGSNTIVVQYPPPGATIVSSNLTIIMNQYGNPYGTNGDAWTYTAGAAYTNYQYLTFTDDTNLTTVPIKYAIPPFRVPDAGTNYSLSDFEQDTNGVYLAPTNIADGQGGWTVPTNVVVYTSTFVTNNGIVTVTNPGVAMTLSNNEVSVVTDPVIALEGSNYLALANGTITRTIPTIPGRAYNITYWYRGPDIEGWWRGEGNAMDSSDPESNYGNNGLLIGRFTFPAGEVGQAFGMINPGQPYTFAGTNAYVQIPQPPLTTSNVVNGTNALVQSSPLDVGAGAGFTIEGWINPTNVAIAQPLVEWLARVPTNAAVTNLVIIGGPFVNPVNSHYYYLLGTNNFTNSEYMAEQLGGHLATVRNANEENWIYDQFSLYGGINRNLWIGLTNSGGGSFGWVDGETNSYLNWLTGQPSNPDGTRNYTGILGRTNNPAGLWLVANLNGLKNPLSNTNLAYTNLFYGVVEVDNIQTNGVQLWISMTNSTVTSNGCLYADLIDITNGIHELYSPPGLIQSNVFQHVALTYNTNSGIATLYYNGTNVASTNFGVIIPKTTGDVLLGKDMSLQTNNFFSGEMDEMSIYARLLSASEIQSIYSISALSTNRNVGKFDPAITPEVGLAEALVNIGGVTNIIYGVNKTWQLETYTFTATTNSVPVQITGLEPGILLDAFSVTEAALTNIYYEPETTLAALIGDSAYGDWTLEIWDNRSNTSATNELVSWQLQFTVQTNPPVVLNPNGLATNSVPPNSMTYYSVTVPSWAIAATNILVSASVPVNLYFNSNTPPTGVVPPDTEFLANSTAGSYLITDTTTPATTPALIPGETYYLGVQNPNSVSATVVLSVDFGMVTLTNGAPYTNTLATNYFDTVQYYTYNVSTNAYEAIFQLLKLDGNADLVVSKGAPLPTLTNADYGSFSTTNADQIVYVLTNSTPVPLTPGVWYLGVIRNGPGPVDYSVLAQELDNYNPTTTNNASVTITTLTNGVPFNFTAGPGADLTNFFQFQVTNTLTSTLTNYVRSIHFELYNLTGNGDLTVQSNALPLSPPFFQTSQQRGRIPEIIYITTNSVLTNLAANWFLGVPNNEVTNISYTILAVIDTNAFPAFPGAEGAGAVSVGGRAGSVYHVTSLADDGSTNTLRDAVSQTNRTVVFDVSGTITLLSPLVITNSFLTLAGQTAPGDGITVAGPVTIQSTHDVVLRYLRFRIPTNGISGDTLNFTNSASLIADHVSTSWTPGNLVAVLNSTNVTVQWSIMADSLYATNNSGGRGSYVRYGYGAVSLHHNLYADNFTASPGLGDNVSLDFVDNVIYNWGLFSGLSYTNDPVADVNGSTNQLNYVCNYLIAGADTASFATNYAITNIAFYGGTSNTWIYQTNNLIDANTNGLLDGGYTGWGMFTNLYTPLNNPLSLAPITTDEAYQAYEKVLDFAGVAMEKRDSVDFGQVEKVRNQTARLISTGGTLPTLASGFPWQDTSGDGIPDFWKETFGLVLTNNYNTTLTTNANFIGYSDLEEYLNWLAVPHALTLTNQPVNIDLQQLSGKTGQLAFFVTNAINGSVYLTNHFNTNGTVIESNSIAVFTPSNDISGYAYFDYYVTNNDSSIHSGSTNVAFIGPVTVAVIVSGFATTEQSVVLTNGQPVTNTIAANAIGWYQVNVPTNAVYATNILLSLTGPGGIAAVANLWWSTNLPPSITAVSDVELITNAASGSNDVLSITSSPALVPGATYYLGVQNTNSFGVSDVVQVDFGFLTTNSPPYLPNVPNQLVIAGGLLDVTNPAIDYNPSALVYGLTTNLPTDNDPAISTAGVITWQTSLGDAGTNILFTETATDSGTSLSASTSFTVTVLPAIDTTGTNGSGGLTNVVAPNGINWYIVQVPTNAIAATNTLLFATLPVNLWYSTNIPPTITNSGDFELLTNSIIGTNVISTTTVPTLVPGSTYLLGVQNPNSMSVTDAINVTFRLNIPIVLNFPLFITATNISGTNGYLLTWYTATNYQFHVQWTTNLAPPKWLTITGVVSYANFVTATNSQFMFFDDGTRTGGLNRSNRFYRLLLLNSPSNTVPYFLHGTSSQNATPGSTLTVSNTAADWDIPAQSLTYAIYNTLTNGPTINTANGIITWTPTVGQAGLSDVVTTVATDNGVPPKSVTNSFAIFVSSLTAPSISSVTLSSNQVNLQWSAPTNEQFVIRWTTNLLPPVAWTNFPGTVTSTNGVFHFSDTNPLVNEKFYQLLLP